MSTALAEREAPAVTGEQMDLVRKTVANGATDAELKLFLYDCQRRGIHPLDKLLHFTKRGGKYTPVTSIDFMRSQAAASGEMAGSDDPVFTNFYADGEASTHPLAATVTVYRMTQGQRFSYTATARWSEYCPDNAPMWRRMPHTMLGKCAEALALRKAFPQQLAGLYSREEMDQADSQTLTGVPSRDPVDDRKSAPLSGPSVPNGGDSGTTIDHETGEERPAPPKGYFYVANYTYNSPWHEADLLKYDAQGGGLHVSTKLKCGELLNQAANFHLPAKCDVTMKKQTKGEAYLNKVTLLKAPEPAGAPLDASAIPF